MPKLSLSLESLPPCWCHSQPEPYIINIASFFFKGARASFKRDQQCGGTVSADVQSMFCDGEFLANL